MNKFDFDSSALNYTNAGTDFSNARLLNDVFHDSGYYVETNDGAGYEYYHASLSLTATDTSTSTASVDFTSPDPGRFETIEKINGSSVVKLDEANVEVNYTAQNENGVTTTYSDVLRQDTDGRYYFRLSNDLDADTESFLKATLTDNLKTGNTLVQTSEGASKVFVYFDFDFWASTDADLLQAGSGEKRTVINITAESDKIRIKQPSDPLATLDRAIARIDEKRSYLGTMESRLDSAIENLATTSTNLTAAHSRILDTDYAMEISNMTKAQILQQASTSTLTQANQVPQSVLSLLG
ncbi:flagellin [Modicisalibacter luteus]|uniref:Flagellin n=1 Tax=Modicisalibacter luteus TaxID=453962 RepID=A0ABV7M2L0_9GAMM|nr:flagellin [Halomonas lutea]